MAFPLMETKYSRGEAIKKARAFSGTIVPVPDEEMVPYEGCTPEEILREGWPRIQKALKADNILPYSIMSGHGLTILSILGCQPSPAILSCTHLCPADLFESSLVPDKTSAAITMLEHGIAGYMRSVNQAVLFHTFLPELVAIKNILGKEGE